MGGKGRGTWDSVQPDLPEHLPCTCTLARAGRAPAVSWRHPGPPGYWPIKLPNTISLFPEERQSTLWQGELLLAAPEDS